MKQGTSGADPVLHSQARIRIMVRLVLRPRWRFAALQRQTNLTSGNLASHLRVLEASAYVRTYDAVAGLRRVRVVEATRQGTLALKAYVAHLRAMIETMEEAVDASADTAHGLGGPAL